MRGITLAATALAWTSIAFGQSVMEEGRLPTLKRAHWFAMSRSGQLAVTGAEDRRLRVWNLANRRLLRAIDLGPAEVNIEALSDDGALALVADLEGGVRIFDTATGLPRIQTKVWPYVGAATFSADGKLLALAPVNEPVRVIDIASGRKRYELQRTIAGNAVLAFSRDGARIAAGDADTVVRVYDARNGEMLSRFTDFLLEPFTIAFAPDGKHLAAAGADKLVAVLDAANARVISRTDRQADAVAAVKFSPDGRHLAVQLMNSASMSKPAPLMVWEVSGTKKVLEWNPPSAAIGGGWTDDGRLLIGTSSEDTVHVWRVR